MYEGAGVEPRATSFRHSPQRAPPRTNLSQAEVRSRLEHHELSGAVGLRSRLGHPGHNGAQNLAVAITPRPQRPHTTHT